MTGARCACTPRCKLSPAPGQPFALAHDKRPERQLERSERMRQIRAAKGAVDFSKYKDDPVGFARDVLGIEPWERVVPDSDSQADVLRAVAAYDRVALRKGHKTGGSADVAILAWWFVCTRPTGRVVIIAPTARQIRSVDWREIRRLYRTAQKPIECEVHELPERGAVFEDGREITGFSSDQPERAAGISGDDLFFIIDEGSGISAEIFDAIMGSAAGDAKVFILGNPTKSAGPFYDAFHASDIWHRMHTSSEHTPNVIAGERLIPGLATRKWVEERRSDWGESSPLYSVRVRGSWPSQASNAVVGMDLVERATASWNRAAFNAEKAPLVFGVDVARFGADESVICIRRGKVMLPPVVRHGLDTIQLAELVATLHYQYRDQNSGEKVTVNVDEGGVGGGVVDVLRRNRLLNVVGVNAGSSAGNAQYARRRDELWFGIADWLKAGGTFPADKKLDGELVAVEYSFTATGKIQVEPKDDLRKRLGRSPDRADAMALCVFEPSDNYLELFRSAMSAIRLGK